MYSDLRFFYSRKFLSLHDKKIHVRWINIHINISRVLLQVLLLVKRQRFPSTFSYIQDKNFSTCKKDIKIHTTNHLLNDHSFTEPQVRFSLYNPKAQL